MLDLLIDNGSRLAGWLHGAHTSVLDDGACPACDHPFGSLNHLCVGAATRIAA